MGGRGAGAPEPARQPAGTVRLRPDRIVFFPVVISLLGALPLALTAPWLTWVLLLPVAWGAWVARARVVASPSGVEVCNGLAVHRIKWGEVAGFEVGRRGRVRLLRQGAAPLRLTALTRRDLPRVLGASERAGAAGTSS